jgi:CRISPR system Cascade subunit CasD
VSVLLLRLEGPLQAWSAQGKLGVRDTEREPTKSGVIGLVGAAMGLPRDDDERLGLLAALRMAVRVDRAGILLHDYHTAGGGVFRGEPYQVFGTGTGNAVPTHRYYLQHASFVAALEGDTSLMSSIAEALACPRYPLFLGRRSCPPSVPPLLGTVSGDLRAALASAPLAEHSDPPPYRMVIETGGGDGDARYDLPLSFSATERRYERRYVTTEWLQAPGPGTEAHA